VVDRNVTIGYCSAISVLDIFRVVVSVIGLVLAKV